MADIEERDIEHVDDAENTEYYCQIGECSMHAPKRQQVARHAVRDHAFDALLSSVIEERSGR